MAATAALTLAAPVLAQVPRSRSIGPAGTRVSDLPLGTGLFQRVLYDGPAQPRATLVMLPGGTGDVGVQRDSNVRHGDNFVVRTRADWVARGYAVLIPDTVNGTNLRGKRSSPEYARLVDELVAYAHGQTDAPVFLLGTSQGTIAAVNGAAHAMPGTISGVILTETVSVRGRLSSETVFDADPQAVRVPALVVANRDDTCDVAPPSMTPQVAAAMNHSPDVEVRMVSGGVQQSRQACGSLSPHGYAGIEEQVVDAIIRWLRSHGG